MKRILLSEEAFGDLNDGFLFYESPEFGLGDYFTACLRADIEGLKVTAGVHRSVQGFCRLLSRVFFSTRSKLMRSQFWRCWIYDETLIG